MKSDSKVEEFNKLFQEFESIVKKRSKSTDETKFKDALNNLAKDNAYIKDQYQRIEDIYALRNVFSHKNRGDYIAEVKDIAINEVQDLLKNVKYPPTVNQLFGVKVFTASGNDFIVSVMDTMKEKVYTHVPVYNDDGFAGVFSYTSFFFWLHTQYELSHENPHFAKKFMKDISPKYLNSPSVNFLFIAEETDAYTVPKMFHEKTKRKERLDCIILSKDGRSDSTPTGIITSWDLGTIA